VEHGDRSDSGDTLQRTVVSLATMAGAAGLTWYLARKFVEVSERGTISDAPPSTFRHQGSGDELISRTVTVNKPREELYAFWRDFTNFPAFMDNIRSVEKLDEKRSRWVIEAPAGTTVEFTSRITEDEPGRVIAWESEEGASIRNSGRIDFLDAAPGRGTMVRATVEYDPPLGSFGKVVAKVLQREPNLQARRDLRRFKQLMETGEVTSSASPSGRKSEQPTEQYL
jgi:uncharacterized membrane protein